MEPLKNKRTCLDMLSCYYITVTKECGSPWQGTAHPLQPLGDFPTVQYEIMAIKRSEQPHKSSEEGQGLC